MIFGWCNSRLPMNFLPCARSWLAQLCAIVGNIICSFSWSKMRNVFCAGKNWNYICQNGTRFNGICDVSKIYEIWIYSEFHLGSIFLFYLICFYLLLLLNNWTRSHFGSSGFAWSVFALPPSPVCLLCSVLSTGMFAVLIACTLPSGLLGSCLVGWEEGRTDCIHVVASEPPNPFWAVHGDLLIF